MVRAPDDCGYVLHTTKVEVSVRPATPWAKRLGCDVQVNPIARYRDEEQEGGRGKSHETEVPPESER